MKSNLKIGLIMMGVVLVLTALMQAGQKEPISWRKTFNPNKTQPYDTYIVKQELKKILGKKTEVNEVKESLYSFLTTKEFKQTDAILYVGSDFILGDAGIKQLLHFVNDGGAVFISSNFFEHALLDTLGLAKRWENDWNVGVDLLDYPIRLELPKYKEEAIYDKIKEIEFFDQLPDENLTILGNIRAKNFIAPNFIRREYGKGTFFIHLHPEVFTNYYILKSNNSSIAYHTLHYLKGRNIQWFDGLHHLETDETPLRVVLTKPALRSAWYILLVLLIIYLIFGSKREQRAIPVVIPETNRSVDFAKTIGSLYYENGSVDEMLDKKINYFLFELRHRYRLDTNAILDKDFRMHLSHKTGVPMEETTDFLKQLDNFKKLHNGRVQDLKYIYQLIEEFKQKANMI